MQRSGGINRNILHRAINLWTCRLTSTDASVYFLCREVTAWLWTVFLAPPSPVLVPKELLFRFSMILIYNLISSSCWAIVAQLVSICGRTIELSVAWLWHVFLLVAACWWYKGPEKWILLELYKPMIYWGGVFLVPFIYLQYEIK